MKKTVLPVAALFLLLPLTVPSSAQTAAQTPAAQKELELARTRFPRPHITLASQSFHAFANNLILTGTNFPAKTAGSVWRNIRLTPSDGAGETFFAGGTGNWSPTRVDDVLTFNVVAGRRYRIGLVQFDMSNPAEKTLISNEVEYLLLMNLDSVTPSPVPHGTQTIDVSTVNDLGPRGAKVVKIGNQQAQIVQWGGAAPSGGKFTIRLPAGLMVPGIHDLHVEENGVAVSKHLQVRLLGPMIER